MSLKYRTLAFIGGGKMGEAILRGVLDSQTIGPKDIVVSEKIMERRSELYAKYQVSILDDNKEAVKRADIIIVAVKPQQMEEVLREIAPALTEDKLLISIAAGVSLNSIREFLEKGEGGRNFRAIRVMPNLPLTVGEGMTEICVESLYTKKRKPASEEDLIVAEGIFSVCGKTLRVTEDKMHCSTALAGSGPAYVFLVIEALSNAGVREGLSMENATMLAAQTVLGAAKMVLKTGKPAELKEMVTSPAGTTAEGLYVLENRGVRAAFMEAVRAAVNRSKELGGEK